MGRWDKGGAFTRLTVPLCPPAVSVPAALQQKTRLENQPGRERTEVRRVSEAKLIEVGLLCVREEPRFSSAVIRT
jgi:hypothetical protein